MCSSNQTSSYQRSVSSGKISLLQNVLNAVLNSFSYPRGGEYDEDQPPERSEKHRTGWSANHAHENSPQSSQASSCMYRTRFSFLVNLCMIEEELFRGRFPQAPLRKLMKKGEEFEEEPPETEELDWWSKYYASLEEIERKVRNQFARKPSI